MAHAQISVENFEEWKKKISCNRAIFPWMHWSSTHTRTTTSILLAPTTSILPHSASSHQSKRTEQFCNPGGYVFDKKKLQFNEKKQQISFKKK